MKNYTKTKIDRTWFSHFLRHPARKRCGSILTTRSLHGAPVFFVQAHQRTSS